MFKCSKCRLNICALKILVVCLCALFALCGCTKKIESEKEGSVGSEDDRYSSTDIVGNSVDISEDAETTLKSRVLGRSTDAYLDNIASIMERIYAPESKTDFDKACDEFKEFSVDNIYNIFTSVNPEYAEKEEFSGKVEFLEKQFGNARYQDGNRNVVYLRMKIERNNRFREVNLLFRLDLNDRISEYVVF